MGSYAGLFAKYQSGYQQLWDSMQIRKDILPDIDRISSVIVSNAARYKKVEAATGVPWYVIGVIHNLEGSGSFSTHLHNGNPLSARTYEEPPGRPKTGNPPFSWEDSAIDALNQKIKEEKKWSDPPDWSIPGMLFKLELYNGTGYRSKGINTPYLWAGSNQYTSGKFVSDHHFSSSAVSTQRGAAVVIRRMMDSGAVDGKGVPAGGTPLITGDYGTGCADAGAGGNRTLSMMNPQSQAEALQILLGLTARMRSQTHFFQARLNPVSMPDLLNLDIQKGFEVKGVDSDLAGQYTCEEVIFTLYDTLEIDLSGFKGDPNLPQPEVFLHNPQSGLNPSSQQSPTSNTPAITAGDINQRIASAASQAMGQSSRSGPGGGNVACAWCINNLVLPRAGIKTIGSNPDRVDSVEEALKSGRGQLVNPRDAAQAGDIIIMGAGDRAHIGIAMGPGGNPTLSNSSSKAAFVWKADLATYDKYYPPAPCRAYRVLN